MDDLKVALQQGERAEDKKAEKARVRVGELQNWETPKMEDVSEQVMAQPYIRFT